MTTSAGDKAGSQQPDVFISYSRKDREFVKRLEAELQNRGREAWVDWEGIRPAEEFMQAIFPAIEGTDTFIFVLSPDSVTSEICGKELAHAVSHNKRMIPIMARDVEAKAVPEPLAKLNWVFAREAGSFEAAADFLISALDTDLGWVRAHTRLLTRAIEWEAKGKSKSFVLRGEDLRAAEQWLAQAGSDKERQPTALQTEYIIASRKAAARRMRITLGTVSGGFVIAVVLAIVAFFARQAASEARQNALEQRDVAVAQQKISRSRELAATALTQLPVDPELSLLLALEAAKSAPTTQAEAALRQGLVESHLGRTVAFDKDLRYSVFSPEGKTVFTVCADGSGRVWSTATGKTIAEVTEGQFPFEVLFSEDGKTILVLSYRGWARLYDASSGKVIEDFHEYAAPILAAVFTPGGLMLVTGGAVTTVWSHSLKKKVGEVPVGKVEAATLSPNGKYITVSLGGGKTALWSVAPFRRLNEWTAKYYSTIFSPNSHRLVHGIDEYSATVRDAESGRIVSELRGHAGAVKTYCFGPDSKMVATGSDDQTARIFDTETGRQIAELFGHTNVILKVAFAPEGKLLVTSSSDNTARVWEIETQRTLAHLRGHRGEVIAVTFSPDARQVVTSGGDRVVRVWNVPRRMKLLGHTDSISAASFSPDSKFVVTAGDNVPRVWDAATGKQAFELRGRTDPVRRAVFSPDGERLLTVGTDAIPRLWSAATGACVLELQEHRFGVSQTIFSPDGALVLTISEIVRLFDSVTGRLEGELPAQSVEDAVFSPDGKRIATADGESETACLWDVASRRLAATLRGHTASVRAVGFDSKGSRLITASADSTARIWNVANGELMKELRGSTSPLQRALFSPDDKLVLVIPSLPDPLVFDAASGELVRQLRGHAIALTSGVFSPSGKFILTGAGDRTAIVWDSATGNRVLQLLGATHHVTTATFSPDETRIVTGSIDKTAQIHSAEVCAPLEKLVTLAAQRVTRGLSAEERTAFLGEAPDK